MKSLKDYIFENYNITEGAALTTGLACLMVYFAAWGIKETFKKAESIKNRKETLGYIWDTVFESLVSEAKEEKEKIKKLNKQDIKAIQIPDDNILHKAIEATNPRKPKKDTDKGFGLWSIQDKIEEIKELAHINKAPYYPAYAAFVTKDKEICGMFGFSMNFWKSQLKNEKVKDLAKKYKKSLHIFDMQLCPNFDSKVIYEVVWETFDKMIKELKVHTITIHADNLEEAEIYKKHGFKPINDSKEYLVLNLKS